LPRGRREPNCVDLSDSDLRYCPSVAQKVTQTSVNCYPTAGREARLHFDSGKFALSTDKPSVQLAAPCLELGTAIPTSAGGRSDAGSHFQAAALRFICAMTS